MAKTNAVRIIESNNIRYTVHEYETSEDDLSGETVAAKIGADVNEVFKTLVTSGDKTGINVFCIPVISELNLKKAALVSSNKKIELVKTKDLLNLTGYIRGGCSPIGMKKKYPTYIDETAEIFEMIYVSAGIRGIQIRLSPGDLKLITGAEYFDLI
jgi:Cys-tRNA(Pro)/Cys-tRNA(Cys) deacylase